MKYILPLISILLSSTVLLAQEKELNLDKGFVTSGYDVVVTSTNTMVLSINSRLRRT